MIAVFGGTFDPPHLGHIEALQGLFDEPGVDRVWVLPSGNPAGKRPMFSGEQRLTLSKIAFLSGKWSDRIEVLDAEVKWAADYPGQISTTWKTLPELERQAQGAPLAWVIGTDQLIGLPRWDRFPEVLARVHWVVLERAGQDLEQSRQILNAWQGSGLLRPDTRIKSRQGRTGYRVFGDGRPATTLLVVPTPARALSSTSIRESLARTGRPPSGALPAEVEAHLKLLAAYGSR